jgi:hypothetical protein
MTPTDAILASLLPLLLLPLLLLLPALVLVSWVGIRTK